MSTPNPQDRLIIALDFASAATALRFVDSLEGRAHWFKVGLELYLATGPDFVTNLRQRGFEVFVDLKLHDIPNTVAGAIRSLSAAGASLLTIHAAGGLAMLEAAAQALPKTPSAPKLLAVTILTSMDQPQLAGIGIPDDVTTQVLRLAQLAASADIHGLICSSHEIAPLRQALIPETLLVVPGIRPNGSPINDQKRIATPSEALRAGASMLVIGRPITHSPDPPQAVDRILSEISEALNFVGV